MIRDRSIKMKLPYFYQLFLGFLAVIIILMTVTVVSLVHFGRNTAVRSIETRLFRYAESITDESLDGDDLSTIQELLYAQGVSFFVFDETGSLIFPELPPDMEREWFPKK
ncbi:MAG: hypothetical protein LRY37_00105 [Alkalibacterium thalassium]|nr:hypothetical protein [Alkalibacterium thalassium]